MEYYKDDKATKAQGLIDFNYATIRTGLANEEPSERKGKGNGNGKGSGSLRLIEIDTGARLFQFRAESAASARTWVEELVAFQQRVKVSDASSGGDQTTMRQQQENWTNDVISM